MAIKIIGLLIGVLVLGALITAVCALLLILG